MSRPMYTAAQVADILTAAVVLEQRAGSPEAQVKEAVRRAGSQFTPTELQAGKIEMEKRLGLR